MRKLRRLRGVIIRLMVLAISVPVLSACVDSMDFSWTPGGCGLEEYELLPIEDVGAVLSTHQDDLSPLPPEGVDALLEQLTDELSPVPYGARVYRIRYSTQDRGRLEEATGIVSVPWLEEGVTERFPIVLWLHGTTGFNGECAPSRLGGEHLLANYLLSALGYIVVAPDFIGLDGEVELGEPQPVYHAYLNIEQTAVGSWDLVRAARSFFRSAPEINVRASNEVALWGGSQGGHAAFSCDLLQPFYAPEYDIQASIALIPPTDLFGQARWALSDVVPTTAAMAAFFKTQQRWYGQTVPLKDVFVPQLVPKIYDAMYFGCNPAEAFSDVRDVSDAFRSETIRAVLEEDREALDRWACFIERNSLTETPVPRMNETPTLMVLGENDRLVYTPVEQEAFDTLCEKGYNLEYLECADAGHTDAAGWSFMEQIDWLDARMSGVPIDEAKRCVRSSPVRCSGQPES